MKAVFIYCLKDPVTGDVRYIGKTDNLKKRFSEHIKGSAKKKTYLGNWLKSLSGEKPILAVLHEVSEGESWAEEERRYISCARALGMDLVNLTDGGDGTPGWVPTPENRASMSEAMRRTWTPERRATVIGVPLSPERRASISAALKGVPVGPFSPEHCAAMSAASKGVSKSAAHRENMKGSKSPEHCAAMRAARKGVPWTAAQRAAYERGKQI